GATTDSAGAVSTSCTVSYTPTAVGPHTITASYSGDTTHEGSTGDFVARGLKQETSTGVSCSPASVPVGSPTSCTATVTAATPGSATAPTRTVRLTPGPARFPYTTLFRSGATTDSAGAVSTSCTVSYTPTAVGPHTITASYSGDT